MRIGRKNKHRDHLSITKVHLKAGMTADPAKCPIAICLVDAGYKKVRVGDYCIEYGDRESLSIDDSLTQKIVDIDGQVEVEHFDIMLDFDLNTARVEEDD